MSYYIMRLDDACEKRDVVKWNKMERLLDHYGICPLVGVIPDCQDSMMDQYEYDPDFWARVHEWRNKGWIIAMHGYQHLYTTTSGGINPVNPRSEFAGEPLEIQKEKISNGISIMKKHGIAPTVFFAPSHTFDENTIIALKEQSEIRIMSDTIANRPYSAYGITFVPQQSGSVRNLPFHTVTFCYHPNSIKDEDFERLEFFLDRNRDRFISFPTTPIDRKRSIFDRLLKWMYYARR